MNLRPAVFLIAAALLAAPALRAQSADAVIDESEAESAPVLNNPMEVLNAVERLYPPGLARARVSGTPTVRFVVDAGGVPAEARVATSSGRAALDEAALAAVQVMRFDPARRGGAPVAVRTTMGVSFTPPAGAEAPSRVPEGAYQSSRVQRIPELRHANDAAQAMRRFYPPSLRARRERGQAIVRFLVDERGKPTFITVEHSSRPEFGAASVRVVETLRFSPALVGGEPVRVWVSMPLAFEPPLPEPTPLTPSERGRNPYSGSGRP